jgi:rhodanese-related sulfurtransferase
MFGLAAAVWVVAALTMTSGLVVSWRMKETLQRIPLKPERPCIKAEDLRNVLEGKPILILDVRSSSEFSAGNIPGSINIPVDELQEHIRELAHDRFIVTVCGKGGGRSLQAANLLRENGRPDALYLCDGYMGWEAAQKRKMVS